MSGFKLRGIKKKDGEKQTVKEAPPELKDVAPQQEEFLDVKPSTVTTVVKEMFQKAKPVKLETSTVPLTETPSIHKKEEKKVVQEKEKLEKPADLETVLEEDYDDALEKLGKLILEEDKGDHYVNEIPTAYIPESRRGFSEFIKENYSEFMLKPIGEQDPIAPGDKYPYQKFVREYIRQASPYRGILVYHGLGSGKTCSAIAALEALFSTSHKKIIVMTPFSLRKNFLKEITFCGFKHYRLQNYWVPLDKTIPIHVVFAEKVLNISKLHLKSATHIWVPDFEQEPNYNSLTSDEQTEIRKQILSSLVYDKKTNPTGRIHFINYNGISANRLKEIACKESTFFDNAVIVVDEIHNLIRLMTGKIEPYLAAAAGRKRRIVQETIGADKWSPSLCLTARNYRRGYLFYRLLLSATNSKIIGLSGTPLINFPEELGILANVLHGYIPVIEGIVSITGDENRNRIQSALLEYEYIDFVRVEPDKAGNGIRFTVSLLPDGVRKIANDVGVERLPEGVDAPTKQEILEDVKQLFVKKGLSFSLQPQLIAKPLLPIYYKDYENNFLKGPSELKNKAVLLKRLTGIISYYKGSRQDLMPKVMKDVVVRCPMSEYQQNKYILDRVEEIENDKQKKKKGSSVGSDPIWAEVFDIAQRSSSNSYRMGSRQVCNFAFPPQVTRPRPRTQAEVDIEAHADEDINETAPDLSATALELDEEFPEIEEDVDDVSKEQIAAEEAAASTEEDAMTGGDYDENDYDEIDYINPQQAVYFSDMSGGGDGDDDDDDDESGSELQQRIKKAIQRKTRIMLAQQLVEGATEEQKKALKKQIRKDIKKKVSTGELTVEMIEKEIQDIRMQAEQYKTNLALQAAAPKVEKKVVKPKTAKAAIEQMKIQKLSDCKAGKKEDETYKEAILRAKRCLVEFASDNLRIDNPQGLAVLSSKYIAMLKIIQDAPGSSLVYSQFLDMEGIGIFRIVMDINGYAPIEIIPSNEGGYTFSERTLASFKKGGLQPRYITFSGAEAEDVRKMGLDVFNARFNELPEKLSKVLLEAGFSENDNKRGQICRVFCITSAGAEGLSLKNVRAVHIMEPYWNDVRLKQVKGRAIRIGSHLDLPVQDRNVSIYTYVSVFTDESQKARAGPMKISETLSIKDSFSRADAIEYGLPIKDDMLNYTVTSDEYLLLISTIKKKIIDELETIMKSAAIDCELNYAENKDGTFKCLPLKGKVGDFLYHPDIQTDILESESMYKLEDKKEEKKLKALTYKGVRYLVDQKVIGNPVNETVHKEAMKRYYETVDPTKATSEHINLLWSKYGFDIWDSIKKRRPTNTTIEDFRPKEPITKFILYSPDNLEVEVGETSIKDGKPALPITLY
jgi:hypothetical protein